MLQAMETERVGTVREALELANEVSIGWSSDTPEAFLAPLYASPEEVAELLTAVADEPQVSSTSWWDFAKA
jgi:hypothetical protein